MDTRAEVGAVGFGAEEGAGGEAGVGVARGSQGAGFSSGRAGGGREDGRRRGGGGRSVEGWCFFEPSGVAGLPGAIEGGGADGEG